MEEEETKARDSSTMALLVQSVRIGMEFVSHNREHSKRILIKEIINLITDYSENAEAPDTGLVHLMKHGNRKAASLVIIGIAMGTNMVFFSKIFTLAVILGDKFLGIKTRLRNIGHGTSA